MLQSKGLVYGFSSRVQFKGLVQGFRSRGQFFLEGLHKVFCKKIKSSQRIQSKVQSEGLLKGFSQRIQSKDQSEGLFKRFSQRISKRVYLKDSVQRIQSKDQSEGLFKGFSQMFSHRVQFRVFQKIAKFTKPIFMKILTKIIFSKDFLNPES